MCIVCVAMLPASCHTYKTFQSLPVHFTILPGSGLACEESRIAQTKFNQVVVDSGHEEADLEGGVGGAELPEGLKGEPSGPSLP